MPEIVVYRYGHRPARDKRITTHVALTARAMGANSIIVDTGDSSLEENIYTVNRNFGGTFSIKSGVGINQFLNSLDEDDILIHLTMYGKPVNKKIDEIKKAVSHKKRMIIFVGAEKVPGIVYSRSDFNISVTGQPISEVSALAIFLDRFFDGDELNKDMKGRLNITPNERGKTIDYYPDEKDCMDILINRGADGRLIGHSIAVNAIATAISEHIECDKRVIIAGSLLHDVGRTATNGIMHAVESYKICQEEHVSMKICNTVLKHTGAGITVEEAKGLGLPGMDFMPQTIEEKIVACADNLIKGSERIDIMSQIDRYRNKNLDVAAQRIDDLYKFISSEAKFDVNEIKI